VLDVLNDESVHGGSSWLSTNSSTAVAFSSVRARLICRCRVFGRCRLVKTQGSVAKRLSVCNDCPMANLLRKNFQNRSVFSEDVDRNVVFLAHALDVYDNQSISKSKHFYVAPYIARESETHSVTDYKYSKCALSPSFATYGCAADLISDLVGFTVSSR